MKDLKFEKLRKTEESILSHESSSAIRSPVMLSSLS